jgi:hypothetical protein
MQTENLQKGLALRRGLSGDRVVDEAFMDMKVAHAADQHDAG